MAQFQFIKFLFNFILSNKNMTQKRQQQRPKSFSSCQIGNSLSKKTDLLKFLNEQNVKIRHQGKKCRPKQQFGVSSQSPQHFKSANTLVSDYGYIYTIDESPSKNNYEYYSQKHFINISNNEKSQDLLKKADFLKQYQKSLQGNKLAFHRRKGRMTDFMQKNAWMGGVYNIMGDQRNAKSRESNNRDRQRVINSRKSSLSSRKKPMTAFDTTRKSFLTNTTKKSNILGAQLISEKSKIRQMRNDFMTLTRKSLAQDATRPMTTMAVSYRTPNDYTDRIQKLKLFDRRIKQYKITNNEWDQYDSAKAQNLYCQKQQQWLRSTCGSKFSNPRSAFSFQKRRIKGKA